MSKIKANSSFYENCTACPRLADYFTQLRVKYPSYRNLPVAPFGDKDAKLLIIGLAPGLKGANATGRPFTGDYAGELLYSTMFKYGFSNQAYQFKRGETDVSDGLKLINSRITNAVKCLPPENKPTTDEINTCNPYLTHELSEMSDGAVLLTLGLVSHKATLKALGYKQSAFKFVHGAVYQLKSGDKTLNMVNSYHCSRYNTSTKRLTEKMFHQMFATVKKLVKKTN